MADLKARLAKADRYAALIAATIAARIVSEVERDGAGPESLVVEASRQENWDDIVVATTPFHQTNWQIKRQRTPFALKTINGLFKGIGDLRRQASVQGTAPPDEFRFGITELGTAKVKGGTDLELRVLQELCDAARTPGAVAGSLKTDTAARRAWWDLVFSQAGAQDDDEVFEILKQFFVLRLGPESEVRQSGVDTLRSLFRNPERVFEELYNTLWEFQSPANSFDYPVLREHVLARCAERDPNSHAWIRFSRPDAYGPWRIAGTLSPSAIVSEFWTKPRDSAELYIEAQPKALLDSAEQAILRLVAHRPPNLKVEADDANTWHARLQRSCGGTLGMSPNVEDCAPDPPAPRERSACLGPTRQQEELSALLSRQMDDSVLSIVLNHVDACLRDPELVLALKIDGPLLQSMGKLWLRWKKSWESDDALYINFVQGLVVTASEWDRTAFDRQARLGPRNTTDLARAIIIGLAIGVALSNENEALLPNAPEKAVNLAIHGCACHLLALSYVSTDAARFGVTVADAAHEFVSEEPGLTILANEQTRASDLVLLASGNNLPFSVEETERTAYQTLYSTTPLLTAEAGLTTALKTGAGALRAFMGTLFEHLTATELEYLKRAVAADDGIEEAP